MLNNVNICTLLASQSLETWHVNVMLSPSLFMTASSFSYISTSFLISSWLYWFLLFKFSVSLCKLILLFKKSKL